MRKSSKIVTEFVRILKTPKPLSSTILPNTGLFVHEAQNCDKTQKQKTQMLPNNTHIDVEFDTNMPFNDNNVNNDIIDNANIIETNAYIINNIINNNHSMTNVNDNATNAINYQKRQLSLPSPHKVDGYRCSESDTSDVWLINYETTPEIPQISLLDVCLNIIAEFAHITIMLTQSKCDIKYICHLCGKHQIRPRITVHELYPLQCCDYTCMNLQENSWIHPLLKEMVVAEFGNPIFALTTLYETVVKYKHNLYATDETECTTLDNALHHNAEQIEMYENARNISLFQSQHFCYYHLCCAWL